MSSIDQVEDAGSAPLLGSRACCTHAEEVEEMMRVPYEDEGALARARRVLSCRRMLRRNEVAGSLGDLGTFLPDVVSLTNVGAHPHPESFVFFAGVWSVFAGCAYDLPMPVQPMHTVTAVSLTEGLSYAQLVAAGIWLGGIFALLGATARLDQGVVTNWGSARLVPRVWLAAGNGHPGLVVDDCVRFRVDVMILGERRVDVNPLGGLALPLAREVVGAPITPVKRRSIISPMKGRAR